MDQEHPKWLSDSAGIYRQGTHGMPFWSSWLRGFWVVAWEIPSLIVGFGFAGGLHRGFVGLRGRTLIHGAYGVWLSGL